VYVEAFLGVDVGTTNSKACLFAVRGGLIASASERTPVDHDDSFGECHRAEDLWQTTARVIRNCLEQAQSVTADHITVNAVAIASFAEEGVCLDADLQPVTPIIPWYDGRTEEQVSSVAERLSPVELRRLTGMPLDRSFSLCKLLWIKKYLPAAWARTVYFLPIADYVNFRLSGEICIGPSLASRTLLYSPFQNNWLREVVKEFNLTTLQLPTLVAGGEQIGSVTLEAGILTGLAVGTPVGMGGHDDACAAVGAGVLNPGTGLLSSGTAEALYVIAPTEQLESYSPSLCIGRDATGQHLYLSDFVSTGALIRWTIENMQIAMSTKRSEVDATIAKAAAHCIRSSPTIEFSFNRNPISLSNFAWSNVTLQATASDMIAAVLIATSGHLRQILNEITRLVGNPIQSLVACGGLSAIPEYVALQERELGQRITTHPYSELTAGGAAVLAAHSVRYFTSIEEANLHLLSKNGG